MTSEKTKLKDRIVRQAINSVRKNHKVDEVSLLNISKELGVEFIKEWLRIIKQIISFFWVFIF